MAHLTRYLAMTAAAVPLLLSLPGCVEHHQAWLPVESQKNIQVDWVIIEHDIDFADGSARLGRDATGRLAGFLARHRVGSDDFLFVSAPDDGLGAQRQSALVSELRDLGYAPKVRVERIRPTTSVMVGRYVVTPPRCPDWTKAAGPDQANQISSNLGCATAVNLGLMVANAGDLVQGRELTPLDADVAALAIERYRQSAQWMLETRGAGGGGENVDKADRYQPKETKSSGTQ